jgi:TusA-related sulfurtransferase
VKKVNEELRYDGATIEQVHAMLADPDFRRAVCDAQGVLRNTVTIEDEGAAMTVVVDQVQAAHGIPSFAKKFVGEEINIVQSEEWSSPEKGNIRVAIPGKPGEMSGTALITQDPDGSTETVNLSIKVNIPLVGGKIEGLIADLLSKALRAEHRTGVSWLAR